MDYKFLPLGGAGEIGASCFYLDAAGTGIILDCGMHPQKKGLDALPRLDLLEGLNIDFALITHAHQDHLSALPFLVKKFPYIRIITTPQTRAAAELTLHNSVSIFREQLSEEEAANIYSHDEVDLLIQMIEYKSYNEEFILKGYNSSEKIKVKFLDAGHIIGSASILLEIKDKKIFYTGDINLSDQSLLKSAMLPTHSVDTLILESTYGATDSKTMLSWEKESLRLADSINKTINNGGSVLIPVFSLGKLQEMLALIWKLMKKGKLTNVNIYSGGIGLKINRVYDYNRYVVNMVDPEFELTEIPINNLYDVDKPEDLFKHPCIVLAASGMMIQRTASYKLALHWLKHTSSAIFTVGYMEENTPGFLFSKARKGEKFILNEKEFDIKCEIKNFRFSAHAKREELLKIAEKLKPEKVVLVHGDEPAIDWMGASILKSIKNTKVYIAEIGKPILI